MLSIMSPLSTPEEQAPSSPLSTPEEPAPSSTEFLVQRSTVSPTMTTIEKTDDIAEINIPEDFDNRPSKKAKISESGVLESSPMSPTMSASNPVSECFESIVPESDNQIDHDPLPSPPSPSSSTLTPVLTLHDVKELDPNKGIKVDETYDYLPQVHSWRNGNLIHVLDEINLNNLFFGIEETSVDCSQLCFTGCGDVRWSRLGRGPSDGDLLSLSRGTNSIFESAPRS